MSPKTLNLTGVWLALVIGLGLATNASRALAQDTPPSAEDIRFLRQQIEELQRKVKALESNQAAAAAAPTNAAPQFEALDQKVRILERNRKLDQEVAEAKAKEAPKIVIGERGFSFTSADTNFNIQLRGLLQVDSRTFINDSGVAGNDGIILRRARPIVQGTVFRDFDFNFTPDLGGSSVQVVDAYLNYRYSPALQLRAGRFKVPVGLELLQSDQYTFFSERALPTALVPNRDLGFQLHGELLGGGLTYAAGIFNGVGDSRSTGNADFEDNKEFAGRVFLQPFKKSSVTALKGFGFGVGGSWGDLQRTNTAALPATTGGSLAGYSTPAQQQFFAYNPTNGSVVASGSHWRIAPQTYWYWGPFGLLGEYTISDQEVSRVGLTQSGRMHNTAWQVAAGWVLTGEEASYTGIVPRRPFNLSSGQWGAVQLVARYSQLNIDDSAFPTFSNGGTSASEAQEYAVGLNWFLNRNVRINGSYSHINFVGGGGSGSSAPAATTRTDEDVIITRVQLNF